ncbi:MAG: ABC transporter ATP-binding protein [Alphaproteobacteria bacterium]
MDKPSSSTPTSSSVLEFQNITHHYGDVKIFKDLNFKLPAHQLIALTAPSGAGKSTLLHIAGLLERPKQGEMIIDGIKGWQQDDRTRTKIRREKLGFVFQFHHLLPEFSALENVKLPLLIAGHTPGHALSRANALLDKVGLSHRISHLPSELSGGEQQRVAIARALANQPKLLLADEPTGNLDQDTAQAIFKILIDLVKDEGASALIVTHSESLAAQCDRRYHLDHGALC